MSFDDHTTVIIKDIVKGSKHCEVVLVKSFIKSINMLKKTYLFQLVPQKRSVLLSWLTYSNPLYYIKQGRTRCIYDVAKID